MYCFVSLNVTNIKSESSYEILTNATTKKKTNLTNVIQIRKENLKEKKITGKKTRLNIISYGEKKNCNILFSL